MIVHVPIWLAAQVGVAIATFNITPAEWIPAIPVVLGAVALLVYRIRNNKP